MRKSGDRGPRYGAKIECWKCHGLGHIATECPNNMKVFVAKGDGSYAECELMNENY